MLVLINTQNNNCSDKVNTSDLDINGEVFQLANDSSNGCRKKKCLLKCNCKLVKITYRTKDKSDTSVKYNIGSTMQIFSEKVLRL